LAQPTKRRGTEEEKKALNKIGGARDRWGKSFQKKTNKRCLKMGAKNPDTGRTGTYVGRREIMSGESTPGREDGEKSKREARLEDAANEQGFK